MRRVWIEISRSSPGAAARRSPSMRRVWIEIMGGQRDHDQRRVTLHAEGVD